jgi:hypothetical protein
MTESEIVRPPMRTIGKYRKKIHNLNDPSISTICKQQVRRADGVDIMLRIASKSKPTHPGEESIELIFSTT